MKRIEDFTIAGHHWLNYENYLLEVIAPEKLPQVKPGNFAEIMINNSPEIFLRRPFSIFDVDYEKNTITFFIKAIGKGTRLLGTLRQGDKLNIMYPLGNSFSSPPGKKVLIVGGGSGIAPFILLGRQLQEQGVQMTFLFGGRDSDSILMTERFSPFGEVLITTEDGSAGEKGLVTGHSIFSDDKFDFDHVYTCGPDPMMKAVAKIAMNKQVSCEASLENTMACGIGACLCCVVDTQKGYKCVCTDGPVFDVKNLKW